MDQYLVDYLKSGKAWLLVGSGPSSAIGYPSWGDLASSAIDLCKVETVGRDLSELAKLLEGKKYTEVLGKTAELVGMPRLLQHLQEVMVPKPGGGHEVTIYDYIAR